MSRKESTESSSNAVVMLTMPNLRSMLVRRVGLKNSLMDNPTVNKTTVNKTKEVVVNGDKTINRQII